MSDGPNTLNRLFHEPGRLTIMSVLCGSSRGLSFNALKTDCALTDGNLSRHLKTLEEAGAVTLWKTVSGSRPKTTVVLTERGREEFVRYLQNLEAVLQRAAEDQPLRKPGSLFSRIAKNIGLAQEAAEN